MTEQTVLAVCAHPDDEVLGSGGVLAKHAIAGHDVHVLHVTEGVTHQYAEGDVEQRERAARRCADRLGVTEVHFGRLPDMRLDTLPHVEVTEVIETAIETIQPTIVYTHTDRDVNKDHRIVFESTVIATRPPSPVERVLAYEVPSATGWNGGNSAAFSPNVYLDITDQLDTKLRAFAEYKSEIRVYPHPRSEKGLRAIARARGTEAGFDAAEAFELVREHRRDV